MKNVVMRFFFVQKSSSFFFLFFDQKKKEKKKRGKKIRETTKREIKQQKTTRKQQPSCSTPSTCSRGKARSGTFGCGDRPTFFFSKRAFRRSRRGFCAAVSVGARFFFELCSL